MAQLHSLLTAVHRPYAAIYADATARLAATGFIRALGGGTVAFAAEDLYKKALQLDDASEWVLTATTPTWVQVSGAGSLANDSITNALLANMAQATIKGRASGAGTGDPTDLSATQVKTVLALTGADIANTPAGNIAATDVQAALNELDAEKAPLTASVNPQTGTTYTLQASDNGGIVTCSNAGAITVTVPSGLGAGFNCLVIQKGAGQITFSPSSTTINNRQSHTKSAGQHALCTLAADVANNFYLGGDTAA